jgi:hypothetical protein
VVGGGMAKQAPQNKKIKKAHQKFYWQKYKEI